MRKNSRMRKSEKGLDKVIMYSGIGVLTLAIIVFALLMYSRSLNNEVQESKLSADKIASLVDGNNSNSQSASTSIGKSVEEKENETSKAQTNNESSNSNSTSSTNSNLANNVTNNTTNNVKTDKTNSSANETNKSTSTNKSSNEAAKTNSQAATDKKEATNQKELSFEKPVEGEITKEFAKENLIYSQTLQEWTTHVGIDIQAQKTTVVKAAEAGTVKTIKNDPRYGLTIVIEHQNGFETVYANLLTSEFVTEGEKVTKGQSIGTVGNTAVFEVADEAHLHFEILKDSIQVDPSIYLK